MVQLVIQDAEETAVMKLDGYTSGAYTVTLVNQLTGFTKSWDLAASANTNGRYSSVKVPFNTDDSYLLFDEGLYLMTVSYASTQYAKRLAFLRSNPAFKEATFEAYNIGDTTPYKVYVNE